MSTNQGGTATHSGHYPAWSRPVTETHTLPDKGAGNTNRIGYSVAVTPFLTAREWPLVFEFRGVDAIRHFGETVHTFGPPVQTVIVGEQGLKQDNWRGLFVCYTYISRRAGVVDLLVVITGRAALYKYMRVWGRYLKTSRRELIQGVFQ